MIQVKTLGAIALRMSPQHERIKYGLRSIAGCILLLLTTSFPSRAQHFVFSTYGQASGLTNLNVSSFLQDHTGTIWVGTENGVFIADGTRFIRQRVFDNAHVELTRAMHEDASGRIWVLDSRHLVYWQNGTVRPIEQLALKLLTAEGVDIISLPGDHDAVYILRNGELIRIFSHDGGRTWQVAAAISPQLLEQENRLHALSTVIVAGGFVWAGCGQAICRLDLFRGMVQVFDKQQGVAQDTWKRFLFTRDGSLWVRGGKYVLRLAKGASRFSSPGNIPEQLDLNVQEASLLEDLEGNVILNLGKGIASSNGSSWRIFNQHNGLSRDEIQTLFFDRGGDLWLAPLGHGIMRWHGYGNWEGWTTAEGLSSDVVWSSARDHAGRMWVVTHAGLDVLDPVRNKIVSQSTNVPFTQLYTAVVDQRQHVWTGDARGQVIDFDPRTAKARLATKQLGRVFLIKVDQQKRIWVCSRAGLYFFASDDNWTNPHPANGLPDGYAWAIAESPDGTIWVTTAHGLFRLQDDHWQQIQLPFPGGTAYNFMIAAAPDGTLWSQSKKPSPILQLKVTGSVARIVNSVDTSIMGSDNITFVDTDNRGWLWVGSDDGVQVFNGSRWVQCTQDDGLLWDDTDFHGFFADTDGSVWIATSAGLSHVIHPERLFAEDPPKVQFEEAHLANNNVSGLESLTFDLRKPTLSVRLLNTNYHRLNSVVYQSHLEGLDNEWQDTDGGTLRFPALNPGKYKLSVIAYDRRLHLASAPTNISFTVLEPWWRRSWFRTIEGLATLLMLYAIWRFSVHLLMLRQQELESLVTSRTLELEREKSELLSTRSALLETTRRDSLTGLLNRAAIFTEMKSVCDAALSTGTSLAIAMADLDCFKSINDNHGHVFGDVVLRECAVRIGRAVRPTDWVGRYGGEELLILLPGLKREDAAHRMEELRTAIAGSPICHGNTAITVTCSFGVAWLELKPAEVESLVSRADAALYRAKQHGRNRVEFAQDNCEENRSYHIDAGKSEHNTPVSLDGLSLLNDQPKMKGHNDLASAVA